MAAIGFWPNHRLSNEEEVCRAFDHLSCLQSYKAQATQKSEMNVKFLIDTLIQIPDKDLLDELAGEIGKSQSLLIPDLFRFFHMLSCLFSGSDKPIKMKAVQLYRHTFSKLLVTEIEQSWNETASGILIMMGEQDAEVRKNAKTLIFDLIDKTNNANIVLQKLYYQGLENESILISIESIKLMIRILESYSGTILHNKTSVNITKLILEKLINQSQNGRHIELQKTSREFLTKLFYLNVEKLDDVLVLINEELLRILEKMWAEDKQKLLQREESEKEHELKKAMFIQYEHLPLINGKFFGVYEPYVLKNMFNPQVKAAKVQAIKHFKEQFDREFSQSKDSRLKKYLNVIYKVTIKFVPERNYDLLLILKKILATTGKSNVINLLTLPGILIPQLDSEQVLYRREVRDIMKVLNFDIPKPVLKKYEEELQENKNMGWVQTYEIIGLLEHWIDHNMEESYPPTLNNFLPLLCSNIESPQVKLVLTILDRYPGYRENLEDIYNQDRIAEIEDLIEQKRNKSKGRNAMINEAEEIFRREYQEERERFINHIGLPNQHPTR